MKITNTNAIYLMFLAYLSFTEFKILIVYCCCRPRLTSLFPKKARQQVNLPSSLFFYFLFFNFFFWHFPLGPWVGLDFFFFFFFFFWGGGEVGGLRVSGIVVLPGWIPLQGYYQIMLVFNGRLIIGVWGGDNSSLLFSIYNKSELYIQINM